MTLCAKIKNVLPGSAFQPKKKVEKALLLPERMTQLEKRVNVITDDIIRRSIKTMLPPAACGTAQPDFDSRE